jgi:hypothetical protein
LTDEKKEQKNIQAKALDLRSLILLLHVAVAAVHWSSFNWLEWDLCLLSA